MLELLCRTNPFARDHYVPGHFTASAFVYAREQASLLLIFHRKLGIWVQPGGHVDATDSDILAAAQREIREEVGLSELEVSPGIFDIDIHDIPERKNEPKHQHFDVRFLFHAKTLDFTLSPEVADARWIALCEVSEIASDASVMRAVSKLQRLQQTHESVRASG
jgi:8-oxo-dGTP pyrophosphatase MutT (NUDIX family)